MSFKPEIIADAFGRDWTGDRTRFATSKEANIYAWSVTLTCVGVRKHRVVESDDPVNSRWDGQLKSVAT